MYKISRTATDSPLNEEPRVVWYIEDSTHLDICQVYRRTCQIQIPFAAVIFVNCPGHLLRRAPPV